METKQAKSKQERAKIRKYYKQQQKQNGNQQQKFNFLQDLQGFFITTRVADNYQASRIFYQALRTKTIFSDIESWKQDQEVNKQQNEENEEKQNINNQFVHFDKILPGAKQTLLIIVPKYNQEQFGEYNYTVQDIYKQLMQAKNEEYSFGCVARFYPVNNTSKYADEDMKKIFQLFKQNTIDKYRTQEPLQLYIKIRCNDSIEKDKKNVRQHIKEMLEEICQEEIQDKGGDIEMSQDIQNIIFINIVKMNVLIGLL